MLDADIAIDDPAGRYVSRVALSCRRRSIISASRPTGRVALDIGASTGGFTEVLLERGALRSSRSMSGTASFTRRLGE